MGTIRKKMGEFRIFGDVVGQGGEFYGVHFSVGGGGILLNHQLV